MLFYNKECRVKQNTNKQKSQILNLKGVFRMDENSNTNINEVQDNSYNNTENIDNTVENISENNSENVIAFNHDSKNENAYSDGNTAKPVYYTENYRKPSGKKNLSVIQIFSIALVSAIIGAFAFGAFAMFIAPGIEPSVRGYFDKTANSGLTGDTAIVQAQNSNSYKKVEIIQTADSPVTAIAEKVGPSVVGVRVSFKSTDFFFGGDQQQAGEGSGIVIRANGYILTNYHVVEGAIDPNTRKMSAGSKIEVILPNQPTKTYTAEYVGGDTKTDLAVIKIEATSLPVPEFGNSDTLKVGELAVAIGNPGGMELAGSVTVGVISGLNRTIPVEDGTQLKLIQTDAAINPGNSGGALVNSKGQIIGVNRLKIAASGFEGLGFAIPVNTVKEITDQLVANKYVKGRPYLGVSINQNYTADIAKANKMPEGAYVASVELLSAAERAGILIGDIITSFDGKVVKSYNDLETEKSKHKPGDTVKVDIFRPNPDGNGGKTLTLNVTLGESKG
jgi:serine protease Do